MSVVIPIDILITEPNLAGLCNLGPNTFVILQDSVRGCWDSEESLVDVCCIVFELFKLVQVDEAHCVCIFAPSSEPVAVSSNLPLDLGGVRDKLKVPQSVDCFPSFPIGGIMGIEDSVEIDVQCPKKLFKCFGGFHCFTYISRTRKV